MLYTEMQSYTILSGISTSTIRHIVYQKVRELVLSQVLFDGIKKSGIGVPSYNTNDSVGAISESRPTIVC